MSPRWFQLPLASPGLSPRSAVRSDLDFLENTTSFLGPRTCQDLCTSFKSGVSYFPQTLAFLKNKLYWPSKPIILRAFLLKARPPGWEAWFKTWTLHFLERTSLILSFHLWVAHLEVWFLTVPWFCSSYLSCFILFYFFISSRCFLLVFCFSHQ